MRITQEELDRTPPSEHHEELLEMISLIHEAYTTEAMKRYPLWRAKLLAGIERKRVPVFVPEMHRTGGT